MASSDDLSTLWLPEPSANPVGQPFRQGTIVTFDQNTGLNTVLLAGAVLTNLPLLNIGDTVNLKAGDAVLLGKMNNAMFIMGRVIPAGNSNLTGNIVQTSVAEGTFTGFATTTSDLIYAISIPTFVIPTWCNKVDVLCIASVTANNTTATKTLMTVTAQAGASVGTPHLTNIPAGDYGCVTATHTASLTGFSPPGTSFNCATLMHTSAVYGVTANNVAQTTAVAVFTRTP